MAIYGAGSFAQQYNIKTNKNSDFSSAANLV